MILAEHRPLSPQDRAWLVGRCRVWAVQLDAHLVALEAGDDPLAVRALADETIRGLIRALHERARGLV